MPYNLAKFIIRHPRVSSVNDAKTLPPYTQGIVTLQNALTIKYNGAGSSCKMHLTTQKLSTLVDEDNEHIDSLNISMSGKTLQDLVTAISQNTNYTVTLNGSGTDRVTIEGVLDQDITSSYQIKYAKKAEYLVEVENTGKLGQTVDGKATSIRWTKNDFSYSSADSQWLLKSGATSTIVNVPSDGATSIDQGAQIVFKENSDNPVYDIASLKTKTNEVLIQNAGAGTQFINMGVLSKIVYGTFQMFINDAPAFENVDYTLSLSDNRINFLKGVTGEIHTSTSEVEYVDVNVLGVNGVIKESIQVEKNGVPLTLNQDFYPQAGLEYQGKEMSSGRIFFTKTISEDPIAENVLATESSIYGDDLIIKKNGVPLSSNQYLIVFEAGFLNLNEPLFPDDVLTASYISSEVGEVTDEILAGTPASITSVATAPFTISSGLNDELIVKADGVTENIFLPIGAEVSLNQVIDQYNSQATKSIASKNTEGNKIVIASKSAGSSSTLEIMNGTANNTIGFAVGDASAGEGSLGGDFAFTLANAPVVISSFTAPAGGDSFILKDFNLAANYPANSLIAIQSDLYIIDSSTTENQATLYSSSTASTFRISAGVNDSFALSVDGEVHSITLTSGERTATEICDDINLALLKTVAEVVNFNNSNRIRLRSTETGLVSNIKILSGTANDTLGFKVLQEDTGLLNTVVKIQGTFRQDYENPILRRTGKAVSFAVESTPHDKAPSGVSSIFFPATNVTGSYQANTLVKIGNNLYTVVSSQFANNKTEVKLTSNLVAPLFTTDTIQRTDRPVFAEGESTLFFQKVPISDLPVTIKNNGVNLIPTTDYTLNGDGTVTLSDSYKLTADSNITATYTVFDPLPANTEIKLSYRFFSSLNEGSRVVASYNFLSRDQFFFDIVYQGDLADALFTKLAEEAAKAQNPSSSGFSASAGGDPQNSDSGVETPKLIEGKHRYNEGIAFEVYTWLDNRSKAFTDERACYDGFKVGAADGYVTEANVQAIVNSESRLFPSGYNETVPKRVPALDGEAKNDDGSTTGNYDSTLDVSSYITSQISSIDAENILIDSLLTKQISGANVQGTVSLNTSGVTFYNGSSFSVTGTTTLNSTTISSITTTNIVVGASITGTGIPSNTTVSSKTASSIVISNAATAAGTVSLTITNPANNTFILIFNTGTSVSPTTVTRTTTFTGTATGTATTLTNILSTINTAISGYGTATATLTTSGFLKVTSSNGSVSVGSGLANTAFGLASGTISYTRRTHPDYATWITNTTSTQVSQINSMTPILNNALSYLEIQLKDYWTDVEKTTFSKSKTQKASVTSLITVLTARKTNNESMSSLNVDLDSNLNTRKTNNSSQRLTLTTFKTSATNRISEINSVISEEKLFDKKYAWLKYRADKGTGTVISIKRAVDDQLKAAQTAATNKTMSTV
jgi:hypothetical protein